MGFKKKARRIGEKTVKVAKKTVKVGKKAVKVAKVVVPAMAAMSNQESQSEESGS